MFVLLPHGRTCQGEVAEVTGHKTIGLARLLLYPLMEGAAADGGGPQHTMWLELRTREAIVNTPHSRFSDDGAAMADAAGRHVSAKDFGGAMLPDGENDGSVVVGRLKVDRNLSHSVSHSALVYVCVCVCVCVRVWVDGSGSVWLFV